MGKQVYDLVINHFGGLTAVSLLILVLYIIYQSHRGHHLDWADLVKAKGTNNVSLTKFLQLIGGITGTWMVVYTTLHDKLTYDLLLVYLAYVGAIDGWSKFISAKYNPMHVPVVTDNKNEDAKKEPPKEEVPVATRARKK